MLRTGFPFSGKVIRKNLAVCGADWFALAKPLNCDAVEVMMAFRVWLGDDPSEADPIQQSLMPGPMQNALALHAITYHRIAF